MPSWVGSLNFEEIRALNILPVNGGSVCLIRVSTVTGAFVPVLMASSRASKSRIFYEVAAAQVHRRSRNCRSHRRRQTVVVKIWASNQQSILLGLLGTGPQMLEGRPAQTNRSKGPGRGRSKFLRRGDQTNVMTTDGVMGHVHGSRRDPRKDRYGNISRRCGRHGSRRDPQKDRRKSRDGRIDRNLVDIDQAKYSTSPKGEEETALWLWANLTSTLKVAMASSMEMTWRGPMDSFYLGQEGSEISNL
ncbi:hypothetical protein Acr_01g0004930 [Actinidia rufa]|uniref:Uncharacterized protein n=1 Tax=Actinidia rufa TaxID=165716 RepID=A0A7J0E2H1_9ERIC|nr:hypothetical protein Acr_01g0004930 [Actinidia rufa]